MKSFHLLTAPRDESVRRARTVSVQLLTLALIGTSFWLLVFAALLTHPGRAWLQRMLEPSCAAPLNRPLTNSGGARCRGANNDVD